MLTWPRTVTLRDSEESLMCKLKNNHLLSIFLRACYWNFSIVAGRVRAVYNIALPNPGDTFMCNDILKPRLLFLVMFMLLLVEACSTLPEKVDPETTKQHIFFSNPDSNKLIVFVHGIGGDPRKTWTNEDNKFGT